MSETQDRFAMQDSQYKFPYHHLPHCTINGGFSVGRWLAWGLEYLVYQQFVAEVIRGLKPLSVLEVGCGDGCLVGSLVRDVPRLVGVDLSERAICFAKAFHPTVHFYSAPADSIEEQFDVVVAVEVLEHVPDADVSDFLQCLARRTRPGGWVVISVPTAVVPVNPKHYRHYTRDMLDQQLRYAGFDTSDMRSDFVFRETIELKLFRRLTLNRYWSLNVPRLNEWVWRHVVRYCRYANAESGRHLVVTVRAPKKV